MLLIPGGQPAAAPSASLGLLLLLGGVPTPLGTAWTEACADTLTLSDALTVTLVGTGTAWTQDLADGLTLSDVLTTTISGPTAWTQALADLLTVSDGLETTVTRPPSIAPDWQSPPRLAQTLWTPTGATCACGLGHVGPQGCNAATGVTIGGGSDEGIALADTLTVLHLPGFVTVPAIKSTGVMVCEGFEDNSGDVNNLWVSGSPGYAFDYVPTFRSGQTGGRAVRAQHAESAGTARKDGFYVPDPVPGTPVDTYVHLYWQYDNLTFNPLTDPGYPAVYTLNRPSQIVCCSNSVESPFVVGIRHVLSVVFTGPPMNSVSSVDESRFFVGQSWGLDGRGAEAGGTYRPVSGQPYRIETRWHAEAPSAGGSATTSISASFFLGDSTVPVETIALPLRYGSAQRNQFIWSNSISGGGVATVRYWFDDIMVRSTPFSGPYGIFMAKPAGDADIQFTAVGAGSNAAAVDDPPNALDGNATYVQGTAVNQRDLYTLQWASAQTPPAGSVLKASNVRTSTSRMTTYGGTYPLIQALGVTRQASVLKNPPDNPAYGWNTFVYQDAVMDDWTGATKESVDQFRIGVLHEYAHLRCTALYANFALAY